MAQSQTLSLADLERMLDDRRAELNELTERRNGLAAELDECDRRIGELQGEPGSRRGRKVARKRRPGGRARNPQSLRKLILELLEKNRRGLSLDDLIEKVRATGYKSNSANFKSVVYQNLFHMKSRGELEHDSETKIYRPKAA